MSTYIAPVLDRHLQAAMRALIPHDGAAVHMELGQESESARARRLAVAQAIADAEDAGEQAERRRALAYVLLRREEGLYLGTATVGTFAQLEADIADDHSPHESWLDAAADKLGAP